MTHEDTARLDALEAFIEEHGAILLHLDKKNFGFLGLGLLIGGRRRSLREAIDGSLTPGLHKRRPPAISETKP